MQPCSSQKLLFVRRLTRSRDNHVIEATLDHMLESESSNFERTDIIEFNFRLPNRVDADYRCWRQNTYVLEIICW